MNPLPLNILKYRSYDADNNYTIGSSSLSTLMNDLLKPAKIHHLSSTYEHLGTYNLVRTDCVKAIDCYDYVPCTNTINADTSADIVDHIDAQGSDTFVDPYDAQAQPLPPLHSSTDTSNSIPEPDEYMRQLYPKHPKAHMKVHPALDIASVSVTDTVPAHKPVGLHVSIIDLQAIALATQLQIRAQRKHDESLYSADTITELEWKARRYHNTVLSTTVQQMLSIAELKAIVLDTPQAPAPSKQANKHSERCQCIECDPSGIV